MVILPIKIISICPIDAQLFVPGPQRGMEGPSPPQGLWVWKLGRRAAPATESVLMWFDVIQCGTPTNIEFDHVW